jgi:hypothetical protein
MLIVVYWGVWSSRIVLRTYTFSSSLYQTTEYSDWSLYSFPQSRRAYFGLGHDRWLIIIFPSHSVRITFAVEAVSIFQWIIMHTSYCIQLRLFPFSAKETEKSQDIYQSWWLEQGGFRRRYLPKIQKESKPTISTLLVKTYSWQRRWWCQ